MKGEIAWDIIMAVAVIIAAFIAAQLWGF